MDLQDKKMNFKEFCNLIDIPFELLVKVRTNQEFVSRILAEQKPSKTILETIDEFILEQDKRLVNDEIRERTRDNYVDFLMKFRRFIQSEYPHDDISTLNKDKSMNYINQCQKHRKKDDLNRKVISPHTRNAYLKYIRGLLYFALEKGYIYHKNGKFHIRDMLRFYKTERLPRAITDEHVRLILDETRKTKKEPFRNHAIICFLLATGARLSELTEVKVCDINFSNKMIKLTGKYGKTRYVTLYPLLEKVLHAYFDLNSIKDFRSTEYLFTTTYNQTVNKMDNSTVQDMFSAILEKLGLSNEYSVHSCRHTFAVNCLKAGMKIEIIAELLGHVNVETTQVYVKLLPGDLILEAQKYPIPLEKILFTLLDTEEDVLNAANDN